MKCSLPVVLVFLLLSLIYGSAFAGVSQSMKYFSPSLTNLFRMAFADAFIVIVLAFRVAFQKGYFAHFKSHFTQGFAPVFWMAIAGLLFHGVPQALIAIAQQWCPTAASQLMQPIAPCFGAIFSHFVLPDERFNCQKALALLCALIGVALPAIPSFQKSTSSGIKITNVITGYVLLLIAVISFGIAAVIMKWKCQNVDVTASSFVQVTASVLAVAVFTLAYDTPKKMHKESISAPGIAWLWPVLVGSLATGLAAHLFIYLVAKLGAVGANFITIGQILVGVIIGITALGEWNGYKVWQYIISVVGMLFLIASIFIGFYSPKVPLSEIEEEEEKSEREDEEETGITGNKIEKETELDEFSSDIGEHDHAIAEL